MYDIKVDPTAGGVKDPYKTALDDARAVGSVMALERKQPSAVEIARSFARGFGPNRVDLKSLMGDARVMEFHDRYGLREKHLRDALKELRDAERQAASETTGVTVPKRRRNSGANHATDVTATDA